MTVDETEALKKKFKKALKAYYASRGIGRTLKQKLAHWKSIGPNMHIHVENPSDELYLAVYEAEWIATEFPQDMIYA